jgi:hypothetical protein
MPSPRGSAPRASKVHHAFAADAGARLGSGIPAPIFAQEVATNP